jgi:hypothetical protein
MNVSIRRFPGAAVEALGNVFESEGGFFAEAGGDGNRAGSFFPRVDELLAGATEADEFFSDDALGAEDSRAASWLREPSGANDSLRRRLRG